MLSILVFCLITFSQGDIKHFMVSMCSHGTTMASLNQKIIEKIEVPLPERSIQDKMVEILSVFDKRITTNQKINKNLTSHPCIARIAATAA